MERKHLPVAWCQVLLVLLVGVSTSALAETTTTSTLSNRVVPRTRGVRPNLWPRYELDDVSYFGCLDGSGSIPSRFLNDGNCDCADGSDEAGTGSCESMKFYCSNFGHRKWSIFQPENTSTHRVGSVRFVFLTLNQPVRLFVCSFFRTAHPGPKFCG